MRSAIIGLGCLVLGALGALGYSHYLGEGKQLADLQSQVATFQSDLASAKDTSKLAKSENDALTAQVQQLITTKDDLQKKVDSGQGGSGSSALLPPGVSSSDMAGLVKAQIGQVNDQKLRMLELRLHLTPDQIAKIKAAMDAENERTAEMSTRFLAGQKIDMKSLMKDARNFKTADQTIQDVLTPDQKAAYAQIQSDQKKSQAETTASFEMNQVAPMLNLSETQKDQVESALYQAQLDSQDPKWIQKNAANMKGDPTAMMDAQEKAKEDALASILTPDQMTAYKQQAQSQLDLQKAMMKKFMPAGGFSATIPGAASTPATTDVGSPVPASSASTGSDSSSSAPANP